MDTPEPQKPQKVYLEKSWHFDPATERMAVSERDNESSYQILEATDYDKKKVVGFYQRCPVEGYDLSSVKVIYNRDFNKEFELRMKRLQKRDKKAAFVPAWEEENNAEHRAKTNALLNEMAKPYTDKDYPAVKLLPLWHGTRPDILDSLFSAGYANLAKLDSGYFGKGIYSAYEAKYSYTVYARGALILNWVCIFSAYPVIDGDMNVLEGGPSYQNYDAHFIPVQGSGSCYFPCKPGQAPKYTEVAAFESSSCLPRYIVELKKNEPDPTLIKGPIDIEHLIKYWANNKANGQNTKVKWIDLAYKKTETNEKVKKNVLAQVENKKFQGSSRVIKENTSAAKVTKGEKLIPEKSISEMLDNNAIVAGEHKIIEPVTTSHALSFSEEFIIGIDLGTAHFAEIGLDFDATFFKTTCGKTKESSVKKTCIFQVEKNHQYEMKKNFYETAYAEDIVLEIELTGEVPVYFKKPVEYPAGTKSKHRLHFIPITEIIEDLSKETRPKGLTLEIKESKALIKIKGKHEYKTCESKIEMVDLNKDLVIHTTTEKSEKGTGANSKSPKPSIKENEGSKNIKSEEKSEEKVRKQITTSFANDVELEENSKFDGGSVTNYGADIEATGELDNRDHKHIDDMIEANKDANVTVALGNGMKIGKGSVFNSGNVSTAGVRFVRHNVPAAQTTPAQIISVQGAFKTPRLTGDDRKILRAAEDLIQKVSSGNYIDNRDVVDLSEELKGMVENCRAKNEKLSDDHIGEINTCIKEIQELKDEVDQTIYNHNTQVTQ